MKIIVLTSMVFFSVAFLNGCGSESDGENTASNDKCSYPVTEHTLYVRDEDLIFSDLRLKEECASWYFSDDNGKYEFHYSSRFVSELSTDIRIEPELTLYELSGRAFLIIGDADSFIAYSGESTNFIYTGDSDFISSSLGRYWESINFDYVELSELYECPKLTSC